MSHIYIEVKYKKGLNKVFDISHNLKYHQVFDA